MKRSSLIAALLIALLAGVWAVQKVHAVSEEIEQQAMVDEAAPADVIIVLGAAEYSGRPSPVLEARLNHALFLYVQGLAPRILTTGGAGGDPTFTEGGVSQNYLSRHGVPGEAILVESEGESTVHSMAASMEIMRRFGMKSAIVVSDGYHIFRVKKILQSRGFKAFGSPRPEERKRTTGWTRQWTFVRQALAYGLWKIGIPV